MNKLLLICATALVAMVPAAFAQPTITSQPASYITNAGASVTFSVVANGTEPLNYQWFFNGTNLPPIITTVAGNGAGYYGGDGGAATNAGIPSPFGLAFDRNGNLFISSHSDCRIRKIDTNGFISTVAGNGTKNYSGDGGYATNASLNSAYSVTTDKKGNIFIGTRYTIRKLDTNGIITTIAGGGTNTFLSGIVATNAYLNLIFSLVADDGGNIFYSDQSPSFIREVASNGIITTIAGSGFFGFSGDGGYATNAVFHAPTSAVFDKTGNMYIADQRNNRIRKIDTNGIIITVAGNGISGYSGDGGLATNAMLNWPSRVILDRDGNLLITDVYNNRVRQVNTNGIIFTIAGNGLSTYSGDGGAATDAAIYDPEGLALDNVDNLYIADQNNNRIRKVYKPITNLPKLTLANVNTNSIGGYLVIISSPSGSVTSSVARLSIASPPQILNAYIASPNVIALRLTGTPNNSYILQTATNLLSPVQWLPLLTNTTDTNGVWQFMDTNLNSSQKFYRSVGQ